jgi:curved DNA-binding protein
MDFKDYYKVLGLAQTATPDEVKKAYRKLARKFHPDVSKEADAATRMQDINEAYAVLSDAEKRAAYDELSRQPRDRGQFEAPRDWDGRFSDHSGDPAGASDFFANLFGQAGHAKRSPAFKMRGQDHHAGIEIELADAYHGAQRALSVQVQQIGADGHVSATQRTLDVHIPKGVKEGQQLRLATLGGAGIGGAPSGDLYLEIHFKPNAQYRTDGRDVYQQIPVAPWEAAVGASIEVPTPAGRVQVSVPAGSQTGRKLRLKGRGIPAHPPGDLYLVLEVVLPPATTERHKELYATMAREMAFDPREKMGA